MSKFAVTTYPNSPMTICSPLANSTRIHTPNNTSIVINNINYNQIVINDGETTNSRKSFGGGKKPVISRKSIAPKKTTSNAIKPAGNAKKIQTVERILNQINMTKYINLFKNYDINKFKELRELDLNAMGITRPQELRTLKEAINKAKSDNQ